jgi:alpha-aminoadipate/glutamate carrier protein LysW
MFYSCLKEESSMTANCPECDATVTLQDDVVEGEIVVCSDCAAELEVRGVDPLTLALAPEVGEDWGE